MRKTIFVSAVLIAVAAPAMAERVPQTAAGYDPQAATMQPANPKHTRPMATTPGQEQASPEREALNRKLEADLQSWHERIANYRQTANNRGNHDAMDRGEALEHQWIIAKEAWQRMNQTSGANWETSHDQVETAMDDLAETWSEAPRLN